MSRSISKKILVGTVSVVAMTLLFSVDAHATQGLAKVGDQVGKQVGSLTDVIGAAAFVIGLVFGASGLMKFKQHAENPGSAPLTHALGRLVVAGALVSLPNVIGTSFSTLWDKTGSVSTDSSGANLTNITGY